jgi:3-isopropylmalate/(R)-2-methylmalate dehydratase large subunit
MGLTLIEKILASHGAENPAPGRMVWFEVDLRTARDFGGANVVRRLKKEAEGRSVLDPGRTLFTFDCQVPAREVGYATNQAVCREFAREYGLEVFDVDRGIGSHVLLEAGRVLPGSTMVGTDSHLNLLGAVGVLGQGMGDLDIAFTFLAGKTWFQVPPSLKVTVTGRPSSACSPKDFTLYLYKEIGKRRALGRAIEFYGEAVEGLTVAGRITLASMATEAGAVIAFVVPDRTVLDWLAKRAGGAMVEPVIPDPDAEYEEEVTIDVSGLPPQIAHPPDPLKVTPVVEAAGVKVDAVFIGSCTNGRFEDFQAAAGVLAGNRVRAGVRAMAVPATREVYDRLLESGLLAEFHRAGFVVTNPGCGGCAAGQVGMTGPGEVQVSTSNRNFAGKQGPGATYLCSPATAARAAMAGEIVPG